MSRTRDAERIAQTFVEAVNERYTPYMMESLIRQSKRLLECGYSADEIVAVIHHVTRVRGTHVYSFRYIEACINDTLREMQETAARENERKLQIEIESSMNEYVTAYRNMDTASEVNDNHTRQRNQRKAGQFGVQSGKRTESYFHMLTGQRQDT